MGNNSKAYGFLKQVIAAFKKKTRAIKTRLVIFSLLQNNNKLFVGSVSHKLNALVGQQKKNHSNSIKPEEEEEDVDYGTILGDEEHQQQESPSQPQAIVFYNSNAMCKVPSACETAREIMELPLQQQEKGEIEEEEDEDDGGELECKYPDLTHSLFDSEFDNPGRSVIDIVKNSKEDKGKEFKLEDEIDQVADLFIRRFHHQMRMQKQNSLKRHQEMLERSV